MTRWTPKDKEAAYALYEAHGSLRQAHQAHAAQNAPKKGPDWKTMRRWARTGKWMERRARVRTRTEAKTEESLASWRAREAQQFDALATGVKREVLRAFERWEAARKQDPSQAVEDELVVRLLAGLPKLLELADRFRGGGERHEVDVSVADEGRERLRKLLPYIDEEEGTASAKPRAGKLAGPQA